MEIGIKVYRAALRLLPRRLREKHAGAMEELFRKELARALEKGRLRGILAVMAGVLDVVRTAIRARIPFARGPLPDPDDGDAGGRTGEPSWLDGLIQDSRYAVRSLIKAPRFVATVVLTLALGIGANSAVFSVVNGVVLRPLPFPEHHEVYHVAWAWDEGPARGSLSALKYEYVREHAETLEAVTTYRGFGARLGDGEGDQGIRGIRVTDQFLDVLGYTPVVGRDFTPEEDRPGGPSVAMISHRLWQDRFGADHGAVGSEIRLEGTPYTIVGVLPPEFEFPQGPDNPRVLVPLGLDADPRDEGHNWQVLVRLADGVRPAEARQELDRVFRAFRADYPNLIGNENEHAGLISYQDLYVGELQTTLWILMGAIGLVLLIACANVANLLLARASRREREITIRAVLGATRGRIVRQMLVESLILALLAGGVGLVLARWGVDVLLALSPEELPRMELIGVDGRVLAFTFLASVLTGIVFGLVAALPSTRQDFAPGLREGGRGSSGQSRGQKVLVALESALSVVLLTGAGLLILTFVQLRNVDGGFDAEQVYAATFSSSPDGYGSAAAIWQLERSFLDQVEQAPGIRSAGAASVVPLERGWNIPVTVDGRPEATEGAIEWRAVTPGYFETLEIPVLRGRTFTRADDDGSPPVAIINQAYADRYFPDQDPLGERVAIGLWKGNYVHPALDVPPAEIVGVVGDVKESSLRADAKRSVFVPQSQAPDLLAGMPALIVRASDAGAARAAFNTTLERIDPALPTPELRPMDQVISASLARERFNASLMSTFATLALILTALGIYGVVSYGVRQRTREIGIRMALGADKGEVARSVTLSGMKPVLLGLALGSLAALWLSRFLTSMVWGVSPTDPRTIAAVAGVLGLVGLLATFVPAREATSVDPVHSLQVE